MKATTTQLLKYAMAEDIKTRLFPTLANTYIGIGRPIRWGDENDPETFDEIEDVVDSINYNNQLYRDMIAIKKVEAADTALVVPRVDWVAGISYDQYSDSVELFTHQEKLSFGTVDANLNVATQNTAVFSGNVSVGNVVIIGTETKEIVAVSGNTVVLNTALDSVYSNTTIIRVSNTFPRFANNFYVRNSKDQVFKCLFNNNGGLSTIEPTIDIDGQLPENPYILTGDDYRWKYLYTVPYGLKQKFFTTNWMPVISDASVVAGAVNGRVDIINVLDGGSGYFLNNGESGNSSSLFIVSLIGDGESASLSAIVESGVITGLNILSGGSGFTKGEIVVDDPDQLGNGTPALFEVVISPQGGHGSNPVKELGCFAVMTSVDFVGTESDTLPVGSDIEEFDYRQLSLLRDPKLTNGEYANGSVYRTSTKILLTDPGITNFLNDELVYIGTSIETAEFSATVVSWDTNLNELYVNNLSGNVSVGSSLTGADSSAVATILGIEEPDIELFTGDVLYIENRDKIIRDVDQTEQIRLTLSF